MPQGWYVLGGTHTNRRSRLGWLAVVLCWLLSSISYAETLSVEVTQTYNEQLATAEKSLAAVKRDATELGSLQNIAIDIGLKAQTCISDYERQQAQLKLDRDSLGEALANEDQEIKTKRKQLDEQKKELEKNLARCRLLNLRAKTLENSARDSQQKLLTDRLFARNTPFVEHAKKIMLNPERWVGETQTVYNKFLHPNLNWEILFNTVIYAVFGSLAAFAWSLYKRRQYVFKPLVLHDTSPTFEVVWLGLLRHLVYIAFSVLGVVYLYFNSVGTPEIRLLFLTILLFTLSYSIVRSLLRANPPLEAIQPISNPKAAEMYFWAQLLFISTLAGIIFQWSDLDNVILPDVPAPMNYEPNNLVGIVRIVLGIVTGFALLRLIWIFANHFKLLKNLRIHMAASIALVIAMIALFLGYSNFSEFLLGGVFGTLFLLMLAWLSIRIPTEIFDGFDSGKASWQQHIRQQLNLKPEQVVPGLFWLRLANILIVLGVVSILLMRLWGMSDQTLMLLLARLQNGFNIGGVTIEPLRIIYGLIVFALLITVTQAVKEHLADAWLRRTSLSRGAREASITVFGYVGILLAVLIGLSIAGIDFKNLAIIAGALSVGIGFGLQNIVNNFVSGLILLFERPIRRGDWIRVGQAEGYVRDISIRSTTIQAFDGSDVIVPNSEIISGQVVNMTLTDNYGRIAIPVSVAYGTDTEQVVKILKQAAEAHPAVLTNDPSMRIVVNFINFGENALNFELRCFIRDIVGRGSVISELNQSINQAFQTNGIEMPFPQRTVHLVQN